MGFKMFKKIVILMDKKKLVVSRIGLTREEKMN